MLPGHTPILIHDVLGQTYAVTCWRRSPGLDLSKRDVFSENRTYARQILRSVAGLQEHDPFNYRLYDIWQMVYQKPWTRPATLDDLIDDLAEAAHTGRLFGYLEYSPVYEALEASSGPGGGMAQARVW